MSNFVSTIETMEKRLYTDDSNCSASGSKTAEYKSFRRWSSDDTRFWGCAETHDNIPPGLYKSMCSQNIGFFLERQIIDIDELVVLPDTVSETVINDIDKFWELKPEFTKRGFLHKRGILMWGEPGSGKTSTIQLIIQRIIKSNNIAIIGDDPRVLAGNLQMIRRIEPERPIIVLLEDFENLIEQWGETEFLSLLDGESQVNNVVFLATTNYPEKLDKRFTDRPSRFDTITLIPPPNDEARRAYFEAKDSTLSGDELDYWVDISDGFTIAHLKEMIVACKCYGHKIDDVVTRLREMSDRKYKSDDASPAKEKVMGFAPRLKRTTLVRNLPT